MAPRFTRKDRPRKDRSHKDRSRKDRPHKDRSRMNEKTDHMPSLRQAEPDDASSIAALKVICWREAYRGLMPDERLDALDAKSETPDWRNWLSDEQSGLIACVAEIKGELIAYALAGPMRHDDHPGGEIEADAELYALYIHPDHQRKGLGHRLVAWLLERLIDKDYQALGAWMLGGNLRAENFYLKLGATDVQKRVRIHNGRIAFREKGWIWTDLKQLRARLSLKSV